MKNPYLSIVVPVYNVEKFLGQCLESILSQTIKDFEVVCVNDCSTDNSISQLEHYKKIDERIKIFNHEKNMGLGETRNTGIRNSAGEILGFVDSDDWIEENMYEIMLNAMEKFSADIVQCSAKRIKTNEIIGKYPMSEGIRSSNMLFSMYGERPKWVGAAWNKLYKKELFINNNIWYPPILFEDVPTTIRLLHKSQKICSILDELYCYRIREDSIMKSKSYGNFVGRANGLKQGMNIVYEYLHNENCICLEFLFNYRSFIFHQLSFDSRMLKSSMPGRWTQYLEEVEDIFCSDAEKFDYFFQETRKEFINQIKILMND